MENSHMAVRGDMAAYTRDYRARKRAEKNAAGGTLSKAATCQYEYFARGFEQYMREGNAPAGDLSEVFTRYKGWMNEIYPKESDLNVKLTPEIRAVFGRMLGGR
jgi:hypothetical protein